MHDRLKMAHNPALRKNMEPDAMDIDKQKRSMGVVIAELDASRAVGVQYTHSDMVGAGNDSCAVEHGDLPAKRCKGSSPRQSHLTGAHGESRQEQ